MLPLLAAVAAVACGSAWSGDSGRVIGRASSGPAVNTAAFAGHGRLAFVSRGRLWLLDGEKQVLRRLALPVGEVVPEQPLFSADGRWLAYLVRSSSGEVPAQVWLARGDGTDAHRVAGLPGPVELVGWSLSRDLLAVLAGPARTARPCPCGEPATLRLVPPDGTSRVLARAPTLYGAAWSPGGDALAVAAIRPHSSELVSYPVGGGSPRVWLTLRSHDRLNGMNQVLPRVAGWWRGRGIGFWAFGDGMVHNEDATPLDLVGSPGARPALLGRTLSDGTTDAVAASTTGGLAIVTDHGGGRSAWQDKQLDLCASASCRPLFPAGGRVTVDPAWSPDGGTLAFAEAPSIGTGPWTQKRVAAWYRAHRVWLYRPATGARRELAAAQGATALTWSGDGRSLLYVRGDSLWLLSGLDGSPVRIATPLFPPGKWPQYYAQIPWSAQFAWTTG